MNLGFSLLLNDNSRNTSNSATSLLSNNIQFASASSLLSTNNYNSGFDAFGGKDIFGSINFSNLNESFFTSAVETAGSIANNSTETIGSIASATETAGSVAFGGDSSSCFLCIK